MAVIASSKEPTHPGAAVVPAEGGVDRLSALLERFRVRAHLFHAGPLFYLSGAAGLVCLVTLAAGAAAAAILR